MARLTIPDEPTSVDFTVTTAQSAFPISFALFDKADLKVAAGGVNIPQSGFTFAGTRLEGGGYKGGIVTLNDPVANTTVRVWRRIRPVRPSNFASQTSVPVRSVDMELNKVVAQQQDVMEALRDVEKGVVDPDLLAEVVGEAVGPATAHKADVSGENITEDQAPSFRNAIQAAPARFTVGAPREVVDKLVERVSVKDFGAFGDGASHTLAATTSFRGVDTTAWTLAKWQAFFPRATALTQEIDYLAHVEAIIRAATDNAPTEIIVPAGRYRLGDGALVISTNGTTIRGDGPNATIWLSSKPAGDIFTFKDMSTGGIHEGTIAPLVPRTDGAAIRFDNGHGLVSRDMKFDPGVWHGGAADAEHWSCYDMTAGAEQFLYTVEHYEMNQVRFGFRIGQTGGYVQDVWIGKGVCVARRAGIQAFNVGGLYVYNMPDFLGCYWGLHVVPGAGQVVSGMMVNGFLADTSDFHGVVLQPSAGGRIVDFQMSDIWASSSGTNVPGGGGSLNACGIYIDGTDGVVSGGIINGPRCINNVSHGIQIKNAERISISNPQCNYNSVQSPGSFHGVMLDVGATNISVTGGLSGPAGKFKAQGLPTTQAYGIFINVGAVSCRITSVDVSSNITGGVYNAGTACYVITPGGGLTQAAGATNAFGTAGFNRAPIPDFAVATSLHVSIGGFEPICGFNVYYDFGAGTWRYQNDGPAAALVAYAAGLTLVRFATNVSGPDAAATIASSGLLQTA